LLLGTHSTSLSSLCLVHTHGPFFISLCPGHTQRAIMLLVNSYFVALLAVHLAAHLTAHLAARSLGSTSTWLCLALLDSWIGDPVHSHGSFFVVVACLQIRSPSSSLVNGLLYRRCRCLLLTRHRQHMPELILSCCRSCRHSSFANPVDPINLSSFLQTHVHSIQRGSNLLRLQADQIRLLR